MILTRYRSFLLSLAMLCVANTVPAQDDMHSAELQCLSCHTSSSDVAVHAVFNTAHGQLNGGGNDSCTACHGDSTDHMAAPTEVAPSVSFGPHWPATAEARNASCQSCHDSGKQLLWAGSAHDAEGLACDSCHNSHQQIDPALAAEQSTDMCLDCHTRVRAEAQLPSHHPISEGKTSCTDCHNPHGASTGSDLHEVSINDNCFSCHQEKRGPFLWEHPPSAEDCSLCHRPHGSVHPRLLTARGPALCQQCHAAAFHPSLPYGAEGLAGGSADQNVLGKNCLNCHGQVHGSNHPSGARLTR